MGIKEGAWVGLMLGNVPDFVILALALSRLDAAIVPIDPTTGGRELELTVQCRQTNMEGEFVKWCHDAHDNTDGMILNPGAWTHYAWSIHDALEPLTIPLVEVHLSNPDEREDWRKLSVIRDVVAARFVGQGADGYRLGLEYLKENA